MKITKDYLRSIIKEELSHLEEAVPPPPPRPQANQPTTQPKTGGIASSVPPPPPRRDNSVRDSLLKRLKPNQRRAYTLVTQGVDYIKKSAEKNMPKEGEDRKQAKRILDICLNIANDIALDPTNPVNITNVRELAAMFNPKYKTNYNNFFTEWHKTPFVISLTTGNVNVYTIFKEAQKLLETRN